VVEKFFQFGQRLSAVAQFIFRVLPQFGKGLRKSVRHKQRIVAKAALAADRKLDAAGARAVKQTGCGLRVAGCGLDRHQRNHTTESASALFRRHALQQVQQLGVVVGVRGIFIFVQRGETGGMHAGRAVQGIHFQPGIVRENKIR